MCELMTDKEYLDNIIIYVSVDAEEYLTCASVEHVLNGNDAFVSNLTYQFY